MRRGDAAAAALAAIVAWITAPRIAGFTTDSDAYLDVAQNVLAGQGLVQRVVDYWRPGAPDPLGLWPPLYPLAIAGAAALGVPPELAARGVATIGFIAFAVVFARLAQRALPGLFAWSAIAVVLLSPAVAGASTRAWSETLYLAFLTSGLLLYVRLLERGRGGGTRLALFAGLFFGLTGLTRYAGWPMIVVAIPGLALARAPRASVLAFGAGALLPVLPWLFHNLAHFGAPFGPGLPAGRGSPVAVLLSLMRALRWEFLPGAFAAVTPVAGTLLAGTAIAVASAFRRSSPPALVLCAACAVLHIAIMAIAVSRYGINDLFGRYLLPAYPFLWIALLGGVARVRGMRRTSVPALGALVALVLFDGARFVASHPDPAPETAARRRLHAELRTIVPRGDGPVLTDAGHAVRLATGRSAIEVPPPPFRPRPLGVADLARWRALGLRDAVFAKDVLAGADPALAERLAGRDAWARTDSTDRYVLYRVDR